MGKSALFYVAAATLLLTGLYADMSRSGLETAREDAEYQEQVLAREIAQSAFNVLLARTRADYASYRPDRTAVPYRDGLFGYSAEGGATGPVLLEATGEVGSAFHRISGILLNEAESRFAALTLDGPVKYINPRGSSWLVSGLDTEPPGSTSETARVNGPGLRSVLKSTDIMARTAMPEHQVIGAAGEGDFVQGPGPVDFSALGREIEAHPDAVVLPGPQRWDGSPRFGTPDAPVILIVEGDLTITGSAVGYGALLVKGSFEVTSAGTPRWEGLVLVEADGGEHGILGNTRFFGAMALMSVTADGETGGEVDAGMLRGHFDVSVSDATNNSLYQAHQYDDRYGTSGIDLLSPGCGIEGGLCWEERVAGSSLVKISVVNAAGTDGRVLIETSDTTIDTDISAFTGFTAAPGALRTLRFAFDGVCSLPGGKPSAVSADATGRAGAFSVRITDADTGARLLDVSAYHHLAGSECRPRESYEESPFVELKRMVLDMRGNPGIYTSATALRRLGTILPGVEPGQQKLILRDVWEQGRGATY